MTATPKCPDCGATTIPDDPGTDTDTYKHYLCEGCHTPWRIVYYRSGPYWDAAPGWWFLHGGRRVEWVESESADGGTP